MLITQLHNYTILWYTVLVNLRWRNDSEAPAADRATKAEDTMSTRWEYKVVYVAGWKRVSVEGQETHPEHGERSSGFARRCLNGLGADGAEPDLSVVRNGIVREQPESGSAGGPQAVAL